MAASHAKTAVGAVVAVPQGIANMSSGLFPASQNSEATIFQVSIFYFCFVATQCEFEYAWKMFAFRTFLLLIERHVSSTAIFPVDLTIFDAKRLGLWNCTSFYILEAIQCVPAQPEVYFSFIYD